MKDITDKIKNTMAIFAKLDPNSEEDGKKKEASVTNDESHEAWEKYKFRLLI
jgi:hypothetical protein